MLMLLVDVLYEARKLLYPFFILWDEPLPNQINSSPLHRSCSVRVLRALARACFELRPGRLGIIFAFTILKLPEQILIVILLFQIQDRMVTSRDYDSFKVLELFV